RKSHPGSSSDVGEAMARRNYIRTCISRVNICSLPALYAAYTQRSTNVEGMATDEPGDPPQRALVVTPSRHLSFVIFPSIFRVPNDSERLSTCPAPWD